MKPFEWRGYGLTPQLTDPRAQAGPELTTREACECLGIARGTFIRLTIAWGLHPVRTEGTRYIWCLCTIARMWLRLQRPARDRGRGAGWVSSTGRFYTNEQARNLVELHDLARVLTQEQIAERYGVDVRTLRRWLYGDRVRR